MRGINHQNIFEEPEDYYQFIATLDRMRVHYDEDGSPSGINCTYYAYCLMSNHFHLLIREREERGSDRGTGSASRGYKYPRYAESDRGLNQSVAAAA